MLSFCLVLVWMLAWESLYCRQLKIVHSSISWYDRVSTAANSWPCANIFQASANWVHLQQLHMPSPGYTESFGFLEYQGQVVVWCLPPLPSRFTSFACYDLMSCWTLMHWRLHWRFGKQEKLFGADSCVFVCSYFSAPQTCQLRFQYGPQQTHKG